MQAGDLMKLSSPIVVAFGLVLSCIIMLSSKEEKCLQIKFSKDILLFSGQSYWGRLVFSTINKTLYCLTCFIKNNTFEWEIEIFGSE